MKRKIMELGHNCMIMSLPIKWIKRNRLAKGDELEVVEEPTGSLVITSKEAKPAVINKYSADIEGMNKYQIVRLIRALYLSKIDEITLNFKTTKIKDLKTKKTIDLFKVCETIARKFIGLEIIKKEKNKIVFHCFITKEEEQNINAIEKRIFFMIKEFMNDILENIDDFTKFYETVYERHDNIAKFCQYYMRILIYSKFPAAIKTANYSLISILDKLIDLMRYLCEEINRQKKTTTKVKEYLIEIFNLFDMYYKFLYSIEGIESKNVTETRYNLVHKFKAERFTLNEYKIISEIMFVLHLMNDFHELKRIKETEGKL